VFVYSKIQVTTLGEPLWSITFIYILVGQ